MMRPSTWKLLPRYEPSVQRQIGEGSGGRSPTLPTFARLMSSRTRIEWQKGHTVCAALDHRNWTGAPQLGQFPAGWLIGMGVQLFAPARTRPRASPPAPARNPTP